jgi:hypothetical protein
MTDGPQVVQLPEGVTGGEASVAISLCIRLGLIEDTGRGWLLLPHGAMLYDYDHSAGSVDLAAIPLDEQVRRLFEEDDPP